MRDLTVLTLAVASVVSTLTIWVLTWRARRP